MTWHFDVSGTELSVWDHTQDPASDTPYQTLTDPEGWVWTDYPDDVLDAMHSEAQTAIQNQDIQRAIAIMLDMAGGQIERVER